MFGSGLLSLIFGSLSAYITSFYKFRFSSFLEWALVLPLAYPAYIAAYMYGGILGTGGSFTNFLNETFNISYQNLWFLDVFSLGGAIFVISSVLYPYVYLSLKASLKQMSGSNIDALKIHGYSDFAMFFKILPSQRLALVAGVSLVMMEAMSDYGLVSYFGVSSFVAGIFRTWFGMGDLQTAAKLASTLMFFVFVLLFLESYQRRKISYAPLSKGFRPIEKTKLTGLKAFWAFLICSIPLSCGFLIPSYKMIEWFLLTYADVLDQEFISLCYNTFKLALVASLFTSIVGFFLVFINRLLNSQLSSISLQTSKLGYAVPGAVIGVGILSLLGFLSDTAESFGLAHLFVGGSFLALIYGYAVRFLAVSCTNFESGYKNINKSYQEAGQVLGYTNFQILRKIDFPLLKSTYGTSLIIVFVEVLKELPLTLILRPFNFETLSTKALEFSTQEMILETSVPSMLIVLLSLIPVFVLIRTTLK